ncbi:FecR domain-containing protein [bacterium]|nr:FecR domain-containing protein [bacterium]
MMKKCVLSMMLICLLVSVQAWTDTQDAKKGVVTYVDGQVKRKSGDLEDWKNALVNTEVLSGDKVRTYIDSRAEVDLSELDIIRLAPRTVIDIVRLYEETKEKKIKTNISVEQGELWANVNPVKANTEFDISAPVAAAAITGTILRMNVNEDSTTQLKVYEGEVQLRRQPQQLLKPMQTGSLKPTQIQGPTQVQGPKEVSVEEWVKIVKAMQQITVSKNGEIINFGGFSVQDKEEQSPWIKWNHELDNRRLQNLRERLKEKN